MSEPDGPPTGLPSTLGTTDASLEELSVARSVSGPSSEELEWLPVQAEDRYQPGEELGRGGIGKVYAAFDEQLGREVAVKVLLEGGTGSTQGSLSSVERRFVHEARITGQLEHPAIVPVHELGMGADGALFYTMKRVRGRTLAAALKATSDLDGRLALLGHVLDVCQALAYAHSRGIVHRDLKPANVMVGPFGDTVVLDWGLAKQVGQPDVTDDRLGRELAMLEQVQRGRTMVGTALGTPAYMSPEQARGEVDAIDTRSDVWGLGAMLYEVLTGQPPYGGGGALEKARRGHVPAVHTLAPKAPPELVAVVDKALSAAPADRYADAAALAAELEAWMQGRRVGAFRYGTVDLALRLVRRNKALSAVVALAIAGAGVAGVALFDAWRVAEARAIEAAASERDAHGSLSRAYAERAQDLLESDAATEAAVFAAAALVHAPSSPKGAWFDPERADAGELARLEGLLADATARSRVEHVATLGPYGRAIRHVEASLDGRWLAIQRGGGNTDLLSMAEGQILHRAKLQAQTLDGLAWLSDGSFWGIGSDGLTLRRTRPDGTDVASFPHGLRERGQRMGQALAATPDGGAVAVRGLDSIFLFDGEGVLLQTIVDPMGSGLGLTVDGRRLVTWGERDGALWDVASGERLRRWSGHERPLDVAVAGNRVVLSTQDGLRVLDGDGRELVRTSSPSSAVSTSSDGRRVLSMESGAAVLRELDGLTRRAVLPRPARAQDPRATLVGDEHVVWMDRVSGGHVVVYRLRGELPGRFEPALFPRSLAAGPEGRVVAVADGASAVLIDVDKGTTTWRADGLRGSQVLPVGPAAVVASDTRYYLDRHEADRAPEALVTLGPEQIDILPSPGAGPPDGRGAVGRQAVAFAQPVGPVQLFDLDGSPLRTLERTEGPEHLAFSPDGRRVAVCLRSDVEAHSVEPGAATHWSLPGPCASVAWSPDGASLVAADSDGGLSVLRPDGDVEPLGRFPPPSTVSWTRSGVVVESGADLHLIAADGSPRRSFSRHKAGARHTHVRGASEQIWFGDGDTVRRLPLDDGGVSAPAARLEEALSRAGLVLDGFQLGLPRAELPPSTDPRAIHGSTLTTDRGWLSHGSVQLLSRDDFEPLGEPVPIRPDGTFVLVPPDGVDGEVGIRFEAEGFVPSITVSPLQRAGGSAQLDAITLGGWRLVHRFLGLETDGDRSGVSVRLRHQVGRSPVAPVGCATLTSDPPHPHVVYPGGNADSAMAPRDDTHPADGQGYFVQSDQRPRQIKVSVGGQEQTTWLPERPPGVAAFVVFLFDGEDPTPPGCR